MAKETFTKSELSNISDALKLYAKEIMKLMKKSDTLGLQDEVESLKKTFLEIEAVRARISHEE